MVPKINSADIWQSQPRFYSKNKSKKKKKVIRKTEIEGSNFVIIWHVLGSGTTKYQPKGKVQETEQRHNNVSMYAYLIRGDQYKSDNW